MLESTFPLGRILGIRVGVHFTWFIIFALISFSLSAHFQSVNPEWTAGTAWLTAIITSLAFFASIVLHELGHSVVAMAHGIPVRSITLFIFGGVAQTARDASTARAEFQIAIAGPVVSALLGAAFTVAGNVFGPAGEPLGAACKWLGTINFMVAGFNLLPGFPLDGGRVLRAAVWGLTRNAARGMQWAVASGKLVAYALILLGFFVVLNTGYIIDGLWLALIGWFLLTAADASARQYAMDHLTRGGHAADIMETDVPLVQAGLTVQSWVDDWVLTHGSRAALVQENDDIIGLISLSDCRKLPREGWAGTGITEIMTPRGRLHTVATQATLSQVLQAMDRYSVNQVPVVDNRRVVGWIDRDRLLRAFRVHIELGR
jgi:Zn-dependent protease/predicted transcriptional regulator